ncbi:MAG TPA: cytochrome c [Steroidobacteraceae bacterium]|nr:cytochrome c [Steroidobacteraceae bacterium]
MARKLGAGIVTGVIGTLLVALAVSLAIIYTGAYNVAASDAHADPVRWAFNTTMHSSIANRAGADLPDDFSDAQISEGAQHYAESCAHCHGRPGGEPAPWSRGMRPEPPHLTEAAAEWSPEEIHWIVSHGIKMTGMPAFGPHHSPAEIVALTAFVTALPGMTAEDYAALSGSRQERAPHSHESAGEGSGHDHSGGEGPAGQ